MGFSIPIPSFSEIKQLRKKWTWQEIQWGKHHGIVQAADAIKYACELLSDDREDFTELLNLAIGDQYSEAIDQKIDVLCRFEEKETRDDILRVWRKGILEWLYYNEKDENRLREKVEMLYADFDYPKDMQYLIGYMPIQGEERKWNIKESLREYIQRYSSI